MKPAYPYFGGKNKVAPEVWKRFDYPRQYIEPFFGGGAVYLHRENPCKSEVINDIDGFIVNWWRAVKYAPDEVLFYVDFPVNETEIYARHKWLITQPRKNNLLEKIKNDPEYYDAKTAGYWCYGLSTRIGSGWCGKEWFPDDETPNINKLPCTHPKGINRKNLNINKLPCISPQGINRKNLNINQIPCTHPKGINRKTGNKYEYIQALSNRLTNTIVCCGDWKRTVTDGVTSKGKGDTAIFLDPPYSHSIGRDNTLYRCEANITDEVQSFCKEHENKHKIALCGYAGEYELPDWSVFNWTANGGMSNVNKKNKNKARECIWFSPLCENNSSNLLFD